MNGLEALASGAIISPFTRLRKLLEGIAPGSDKPIDLTLGEPRETMPQFIAEKIRDAEALFARIESGKLFIALATGHNPLTKTSGNNYGAGDFAIDFGKDGSYELGINFRVPNGTSAIDSFGQHAGVYAVSDWYYGFWDAAGNQTSNNPDPAHPTSIKSGEKLGDATFAYSTTAKTGYGSYANDGHYFYEMSVDLGLLSGAGWDGSAFNIHWTENCANDSILVPPE